jgi:hypothetical protein
LDRILLRFLYGVDTFLRDLDVFLIAFDSDPAAPEFLGDRAGCAAPEKRIEYHIAGIRGGHDDPV